jgi:hypothetical protein
MPLGKVANARWRWLATLLAFTVSGAVASVLVGAALGALGRAVLPQDAGDTALVAVLGLTVLAAVRECGAAWIPLPQLRRQTSGAWGKRYGLGGVTVAALWGLDVGSVFSTWVTFAGVWVLAALAFSSQSALFAGGLFVAYWLGRSLSVWLAPLFAPDATSTPRVLTALESEERRLQLVHVAGLMLVAVALAVAMATAQL